LHRYEKSHTRTEIYKSVIQELIKNYTSRNQIYTDGSKESAKVAASAYSEGCSVSVRLPNKTSTYTAELHVTGLLIALDTISKTRKHIF